MGEEEEDEGDCARSAWFEEERKRGKTRVAAELLGEMHNTIIYERRKRISFPSKQPPFITRALTVGGATLRKTNAMNRCECIVELRRKSGFVSFFHF